MAGPEAATDAIPMWQQVAAALIGFGSLCGMIYNAIKPKKGEEPAAASHVVMETASLTDTRPFKDLLVQMVAQGERQANAAEAILVEIRDWVREEQELRRERQRDELHEIRMQQMMAGALKRVDEKERGG